MGRFTRVSSLLGLDREVPQVGEVFVQDAKQQREAEAQARKDEFERFASSITGRRQEERASSSLPVRQDRVSLVAQALNGGRAPGEPLGLTAYNMSSRSVKRSGVQEHENNFGVATDPKMLGSMHMFQSRQAYEEQFDDLAEQDKGRREARKNKAAEPEQRREIWEGSIADRVAELMGNSGGMTSDVMMGLGAPMSAADMVGGGVRSIGGAPAPDRPFGMTDYDAAEARDNSLIAMRQARTDRQAAISRTKSEHAQSVNEDLASKMCSGSIQQQSAEGGLAARVAAALQRKTQG